VLSARVSAQAVFLKCALYCGIRIFYRIRDVLYRVVNRLKEAEVFIVNVDTEFFFVFVVKKVLVVSVASAHCHNATGVELKHFCGILNGEYQLSDYHNCKLSDFGF
jgi:hypothetical protein